MESAPHYRMKARDAVAHFGGVIQLSHRLDCHPQTVRRWLRETWMDPLPSMRLHLFTDGDLKIYKTKRDPRRLE